MLAILRVPPLVFTIRRNADWDKSEICLKDSDLSRLVFEIVCPRIGGGRIPQLDIHPSQLLGCLIRHEVSKSSDNWLVSVEKRGKG
jgi:hypothetical protein